MYTMSVIPSFSQSVKVELFQGVEYPCKVLKKGIQVSFQGHQLEEIASDSIQTLQDLLGRASCQRLLVLARVKSSENDPMPAT